MKDIRVLWICAMAVGLFIATKLYASDQTHGGRYFTLLDPADRLVLKANETAIIDSTVGLDSTFNWMNIQYQHKTNDFVSMMLPIGLTDGTMPLSGPCVIMLNTNDVFNNNNGDGYTGAVTLKVVRNNPFRHYDTLAYPADRLVLKADEAAIITGTVGISELGGWVNFLYQRGTNDSVNMILPSDLIGGTMLLSGPAVIMLNTNDVFMYGAEYTAAMGFEVVHKNPLVRFATLAYPSDCLVVKANETAFVTGSIRFDSVYNWMNILYKQGTNEFVNLEVGLESFEEPIRLPGPAVIMLNTNDVFMYGAEYTGAVGIKVVRNFWLDKIK